MRSEPSPAPGLLFEQVFAEFYPERVSKRVEGVILERGELWDLGREVFAVTERRFRKHRLDRDFARDAFQELLVDAVGFLKRHGRQRVIDLRAWVHAVGRNAASRLIAGLRGGTHRAQTVVSLEELLRGDGDYELPAAPQLDLADEDVERLLLGALDSLSGRPRELAWRRFAYLETPAQIMDAMQIRSDRAYRYLNAKTTRLLRAAVLERFACFAAGSVA